MKMSTLPKHSSFIRFFGAFLLLVAVTIIVPHAHAARYSVLETVPTGASPEGMAAIGDVLYIANQDDDSVTVIDTANGNASTTISVSSKPQFVTTMGTIAVVVGSMANSSVTLIDSANGNAVETVVVNPFAYQAKVVGTNIYVSHGTGLVTVIDTADGNATSTIDVDSSAGLHDIEVLDGRIWLAYRSAPGNVFIIDPSNGNATSSIAMSDVAYDTQSLAVLGTKLYVANLSADTVTIIDTADNDSTATVAVGESPVAIAVLGTKVYVANHDSDDVTIIDTANGNSTETVSVGTYPYTLKVFEGLMFVSNFEGDSMSVIDPADNSVETFNVGSGPYVMAATNDALYVTLYTANMVARIGLSYDLSFDEQGGSSVSDLVANVAGASVTLPAAPTRNGYTFKNWNTAAAGNGTSYAAGATYSMPGVDTVLYAVWESEAQDNNSSSSRRSGGRAYCTPSRTTFCDSQEVPVVAPDSVASSTPVMLPVRDLTIDMSGEDVRMLQVLLMAKGYSIPAGATAYFGSQTKAALSAYQAAYDIAPSVGYFGPITRAQMKAVNLSGLWW